MMNLMVKPGKEGFVCNAELPTSANIRNPLLNLWQPRPKKVKFQEKEVPNPKPTPEPSFPVVVQVYVGALTFLGLYFVYRCTKR